MVELLKCEKCDRCLFINVIWRQVDLHSKFNPWNGFSRIRWQYSNERNFVFVNKMAYLKNLYLLLVLCIDWIQILQKREWLENNKRTYKYLKNRDILSLNVIPCVKNVYIEIQTGLYCHINILSMPSGIILLVLFTLILCDEK